MGAAPVGAANWRTCRAGARKKKIVGCRCACAAVATADRRRPGAAAGPIAPTADLPDTLIAPAFPPIRTGPAFRGGPSPPRGGIYHKIQR